MSVTSTNTAVSDSLTSTRYLEEKGIYIDPQSSFAEAEVDEWVPTPSMSGASILDSPESSIAGPKTPHTQTPPHTVVSGLDLEQGQELDASHIDFNFDSFSDMTFSGVGYSDAATGSFMNFVQHDESDKVFSSSAISSSLWNETSMMDDPAIANTNMDLGIGMAFPPLSTPPTPPARKRLVIIDVAKLVKGKRHLLRTVDHLLTICNSAHCFWCMFGSFTWLQKKGY